jgi:hypothetical protein
MENKSGLVGSIIAGIGALILVVIVTLVIISTMTNANLMRSTATTTTVGQSDETGAWINESGYPLAQFNSSWRGYGIISIYNATGVLIAPANYTFNSATGRITNSTTVSAISRYGDVNISYSYIKNTNYEDSTNTINAKFMEGVDNVSGKIPTIMLIAAIVLLLGVLVLLIRKAQEAGFDSSGASL